jgi:hypothetical protein
MFWDIFKAKKLPGPPIPAPSIFAVEDFIAAFEEGCVKRLKDKGLAYDSLSTNMAIVNVMSEGLREAHQRNEDNMMAWKRYYR